MDEPVCRDCNHYESDHMFYREHCVAVYNNDTYCQCMRFTRK